jgi:hypothetical protein
MRHTPWLTPPNWRGNQPRQHLAKLRLYLLSQKPNRISNDLVRHAGPMDAEQHGRGTGDLGTAGTLCALAQVYRYAS